VATWKVHSDCRVTYRETNKHVLKECGRATSELLPGVLAWVVSTSEPWDLILSPTGAWFRMPSGQVSG
jgi:hypothetical protein